MELEVDVSVDVDDRVRVPVAVPGTELDENPPPKEAVAVPALAPEESAELEDDADAEMLEVEVEVKDASAAADAAQEGMQRAAHSGAEASVATPLRQSVPGAVLCGGVHTPPPPQDRDRLVQGDAASPASHDSSCVLDHAQVTGSLESQGSGGVETPDTAFRDVQTGGPVAVATGRGDAGVGERVREEEAV